MSAYLKQRSFRKLHKLEDIIENLKKSRNDLEESKRAKFDLQQDSEHKLLEIQKQQQYIEFKRQQIIEFNEINDQRFKQSLQYDQQVNNQRSLERKNNVVNSIAYSVTQSDENFQLASQVLKRYDSRRLKDTLFLGRVPFSYSNQLNSLVPPIKNGRKNLIQQSILEDKISETKCEKCNKRFFRRSQLVRHISNHVVHECTRCKSLFYCVRKFKRHIATHESWPCEFCNEVFYEASAWYKHRAAHTMVGCASCNTIFYNKNTLLKHKMEHMIFLCPLCHGVFENINEWSNHRVYNDKPCGSSIFSPNIICKVCRNTFHKQDTFLNHGCKFYTEPFRKKSRCVFSKEDISDLIGFEKAKMC